jgi:hypothetical protein
VKEGAVVAERIHTERVDSPDGRRVHVLFYDDGSLRFRINQANPLVIEEAFLTGEGKHGIIKLAPKDGEESPPSRSSQLERAKELITKELASGEWVSSNEIHGKLRREISESMFGRAKAALGVEHRRIEGQDRTARYEWRLPK